MPGLGYRHTRTVIVLVFGFWFFETRLAPCPQSSTARSIFSVTVWSAPIFSHSRGKSSLSLVMIFWVAIRAAANSIRLSSKKSSAGVKSIFSLCFPVVFSGSSPLASENAIRSSHETALPIRDLSFRLASCLALARDSTWSLSRGVPCLARSASTALMIRARL